MLFHSYLGLSWVAGDAEELPFADEKFDVYTIAFGIRNVTHIEKVSGKKQSREGKRDILTLL